MSLGWETVGAGGTPSNAVELAAVSVTLASKEAGSVGAGAFVAALSLGVESSPEVGASVAVASPAEAVADGSATVELSTELVADGSATVELSTEPVADGSVILEPSTPPLVGVLTSVPLIESGTQVQELISGVVPKGQVPST